MTAVFCRTPALAGSLTYQLPPYSSGGPANNGEESCGAGELRILVVEQQADRDADYLRPHRGDVAAVDFGDCATMWFL